MGKNYTIYFHDETDELLGSVDGKGKLINQLIIDYFNEDLEYLIRKLSKLQSEIKFVEDKINKKRKEREDNQTQEYNKSKESLDKQRAADLKNYEQMKPLRELQQLFKDKKITYNEYYSFRTMDGWKLNEIEEYLNANKQTKEM